MDYPKNEGLLLAKHGLADAGWSVSFMKKRKPFSRSGQCRQLKKRIEIQPTFVELNDAETVNQTLLHEIAHALTPKHGHNKFWKRKAIEIGHSGERCYSDSVKRQ